MGRGHIVIEIKQEKTGVLVHFPILPELQVALDVMPAASLLFLMTDTGRSFKPNYFTHWFQIQCDAAGIPRGYSAHGLRKLAATCHANNGATAHELMAWFGWTTLEQAELYTRAADRRRLAASTGEKAKTATPFGKPTPPVSQSGS
jgi:integrase